VVHDKKEALGNLLKRLDGTGMKYRVLEEREFKNLDSLTKEQERVLKAALDMGYYNFPKDVGVRELALKLGVSTAYISYTLRSAQKKVIQLYLKR
ncbi:MAG: bacterio-opsin activator, partial [Deltaproteobacteria bacterium]